MFGYKCHLDRYRLYGHHLMEYGRYYSEYHRYAYGYHYLHGYLYC